MPRKRRQNIWLRQLAWETARLRKVALSVNVGSKQISTNVSQLESGSRELFFAPLLQFSQGVDLGNLLELLVQGWLEDARIRRRLLATSASPLA